MGLAATFSTEDAKQNGMVIAREARSRGIDVVLQPFINIDRDIAFGRGYNTFGEDPFLTAQIGAAEIGGIQGQGIMSQAKHYVGYDTDGTNVFIGQQALHEIYVAPFAAASAAGVSSVMCSYNKINGRYACGNPDTLKTILKGEVGFKGFVTSDWGATHATDFINDGLDVEMPGPILPGQVSYFVPGIPPDPQRAKNHSADAFRNALPEEPPGDPWHSESEPWSTTTLIKEVQSGVVSEETVTRAAGRVLYQMDKFGLLDGKSKHSITPPDISANSKIILKTSEDSAVLLKNSGEILPLKKSDLESLAMIGPGAGQAIAVGKTVEKAVGLPSLEIGPFPAMEKLTAGMQGVHIVYAVNDDLTGTPVPAAVLSHNGHPGLERAANGNHSAQVDPQLDFTLKNGKALPANATATWTGTLTVPASGVYRLHLQGLGCYSTLLVDGKRVAMNYKMVIHGDITQAGQDDVLPTTDGLDSLRVALDLTSGPHRISVEITPDTSNNPTQVRLNWVTPAQQKANHDRAIAAARAAKTAIVFVWQRISPVFELPGDQNRLIEEIAAVNSNTIVVMNVSQPVAMPWINKVKGVLQMWWTGDEGGWATANVLLGRADPAGRLPFTWPRKLTDEAAEDPAHPERTAKGVDGRTTFSEGIFVGYRWFDKNNTAPLFPFGFGLSYTQFSYSGLHVAATPDGGLDATFTVKNIGAVAGDEVPQIYLGAPEHPPGNAQFAVRALCGFDRVHLDAGASRTVTLHVPPRSLQYWSTASNRWMTASGARAVSVGASSRDLRLHSTAIVE
jgi:beta-glucosidase